jgi:hypothetical protein
MLWNSTIDLLPKCWVCTTLFLKLLFPFLIFYNMHTYLRRNTVDFRLTVVGLPVGFIYINYWCAQCQEINLAWHFNEKIRKQDIWFHVWIWNWKFDTNFFFFVLMYWNGTETYIDHILFSTNSVRVKWTCNYMSFYKSLFANKLHIPFANHPGFDYAGKLFSHPPRIIGSLLEVTDQVVHTECIILNYYVLLFFRSTLICSNIQKV